MTPNDCLARWIIQFDKDHPGPAEAAVEIDCVTWIRMVALAQDILAGGGSAKIKLEEIVWAPVVSRDLTTDIVDSDDLPF